MINKKLLWRFFIIPSLILILSPLVTYIVFFKSQVISDNITDWGSFGSYIGGIVTPIISLLSLIVLGYITYLVSKNSTEENKHLYYQKKKIEAFDELVTHTIRYQHEISMLGQTLKRLNMNLKNLTTINDLNYFSDGYNVLFKHINYYSEFYYYLRHFEQRFGHIFIYDFDKGGYNKLVDDVASLKENLEASFGRLIEKGLIEIDFNLEKYLKTFENLIEFSNELSEELENY